MNNVISNSQLYAVVDIETTGGTPAVTKIMEIAIVITDGKKILHEYSTLINPNRTIDSFVKRLTGITDEMVATQPSFEDKALEIVELLSDKIFVAHNVDFDYNIVKREFLEIGQAFESQKLCTVKSSRKVFPGYSSYSLGNITQHLGIPLPNAHRALDDTMATTHLLHMILERGDLAFLQEEIKEQNHILELPEGWKVNHGLEVLNTSGIVYFHDENGDILSIEMAKNIQRFLYSFLNKEIQKEGNARKVYNLTKTITLDYVKDVFKAEVKMLNEIQVHRPRYNKVMKPQLDHFCLYFKVDEHDMLYLNIAKKSNLRDQIDSPIIFTNSFRSAEKIKQKIVHSQDLDALPGMKKMILKLPEELKKIKVKEYNNLFRSKLFKDYCCELANGYFVFSIHSDHEVEAVLVENHYIKAWGQGVLENSAVESFRSEFDFDVNQKLTRKFIHLLPKTSYKIVK
jgi:DNA polymerase-3 subunit epsilon